MAIDLRAHEGPTNPTAHDSVTHVVCSTRVCGLRGDPSSVVAKQSLSAKPNLVDGGANVCVTGDLGLLLDVVDIPPSKISVALDSGPTSFDDCITKHGLLPLSLTDGSTYYQSCYYCANMVETIVSPSAILSSSDVFVRWTQEGFKDDTIPGTICFSSQNGLARMCLQLECRHGLYYCYTDAFTLGPNPLHARCHRASIATPCPVTLPR